LSAENCIEVELKLRLLKTENCPNIFAAPALAGLKTSVPTKETLASKYFDSTDGVLNKAGIAYRIRREGEQLIATVKAGGTSAGGLHERQEWNIKIDQYQPSIDYFMATQAGQLLKNVLGDNQLEPVLETVFERQKTMVTTADGSLIELALDQGVIIAGQIEETIAEVELELKEGNSAAVLGLGAELAAWMPLALEPRSKYFRGLVLAGLATAFKPDTIRRPQLTASAASGMRRVVISQLHKVLSAQDTFLVNPNVSETFYELGRELRRTSSLLSFAQPLVAVEDYTYWQEQLNNWIKSLEGLNNIDITLKAWMDATNNGELALTPPPWLGMLLTAEREKIACEEVAAFMAGRLTATMLSLWAWLAGQAFLATGDSVLLRDFVGARLAQWVEKLRLVGKEFNIKDSLEFDSVQSQSKKIRDVLETWSLKDAKTKLLGVRIRRLDENLRTMADSGIITKFLDEWMNLHASRTIYRDAGVVTGWIARDTFEARINFTKVWPRFRQAGKRWFRTWSDKFK